MPKPLTIAIAIGAVILIGGGAVLVYHFVTGGANGNAAIKVIDPEGKYTLYSDKSITSHPDKDAVFGNGQSLQFEYDGTKTDKDMNATLSYQLYSIQQDGNVKPLGSGNLNGLGIGQFTTSTKLFDSDVNGKSGFFELTAILGDKQVKLGMYQIKFETAK